MKMFEISERKSDFLEKCTVTRFILQKRNLLAARSDRIANAWLKIVYVRSKYVKDW